MSKLSASIARIFLLSASLAVPTGLIAQSTQTTLPEGVLATVNGRPIPQISVYNVAQQIEEAGEQADAERILDELINLEILTQAAEKLDLDKQPEIQPKNWIWTSNPRYRRPCNCNTRKPWRTPIWRAKALT